MLNWEQKYPQEEIIMGKVEEYALVIAYKYDMAKLIRKNGRATMMAIMPREVIAYETKEKQYGRK